MTVKKLVLSLFGAVLIVTISMAVEAIVFYQFSIHVGIGVAASLGIFAGFAMSDLE